MNSRIKQLQLYPFERLAALLTDVSANKNKKGISWAIGEPKHATPPFVIESLKEDLSGLSQYPATLGSKALRTAISQWLTRRFKLNGAVLDPETQILPVNGTREALFSLVQAIIEPSQETLCIMPNPFYQIYEGATILAGAKPYFLDLEEENNFLPDLDQVDEKTWKNCQIFFACSPSNPTGACYSMAEWLKLLELAELHNFIIISDECYSELYLNEKSPPIGILEACREAGNIAYKRCIAVHSLSKRSNLPGMRSGFVAGDSSIIAPYLRYRTYHGCTMPPPFQAASTLAWSDERHVEENRSLYKKKFNQVIEILSPVIDVKAPPASFYLWPKLNEDECVFTRDLFEEENLLVLPGSYLSRENKGNNPGRSRLRLALVASTEECIDGATRLRSFIEKRG